MAWMGVGDASHRPGIEAIADLMAFITARDGIIAIFQGPAETGPRALGHRSIVANPCNPRTRELLNERVKHREAIRPLAPMATLSAAKDLFELSEGASDDDYNAYNYMVLTARAKPHARAAGSGGHSRRRNRAAADCARAHRCRNLRLFEGAWTTNRGRGCSEHIVQRRGTDRSKPGPGARYAAPRKRHGRRIHVFRRMGPSSLLWAKEPRTGVGGRIRKWVIDWRLETGASAEA